MGALKQVPKADMLVSYVGMSPVQEGKASSFSFIIAVVVYSSTRSRLSIPPLCVCVCVCPLVPDDNQKYETRRRKRARARSSVIYGAKLENNCRSISPVRVLLNLAGRAGSAVTLLRLVHISLKFDDAFGFTPQRDKFLTTKGREGGKNR